MININIGTTEVKVTNARDSTSKLWKRANKLHNINKTAPKVNSSVQSFLALLFMRYFKVYFAEAFLTARYTGRPISVTATLQRDNIVAVSPDRNIWLIITYNPLSIARAGITG